MMTNIADLNEELDDPSLAEHLRNAEARSFSDQGFMPFSTFDKTSDSRWNSILMRSKINENSPHHVSPEASTISELASFDYSQRLPSLESSSSAPVGLAACGLTSQSLFAWQPFATASSLHSQASSLHGPGSHLFPLVSGSINNNCTAEFAAHSPSSSSAVLGLTDSSSEKADAQFNPLAYANMSAALAASSRIRLPAASSPTGQDLQAQQQLRLELGSAHPSQAFNITPLPTYAPSAESSNSQSSTPAHQNFGYSTNGGASVMQQLAVTPNAAVNASHSFEDHSKSVTFKQRSKKESHNRIERKRRDYINSQIVYLSSLLPPELYRDVDGRRNKGSVLRLSVNYIKDLREAVSRMSGLKQENALARQLIPLLLKRIEMLERALHDPNTSAAASANSQASLFHSASFESLYQSWLLANESNQRACVSNGASSVSASSRTAGPSVTANPVTDNSFFPDLMMQPNTDDLPEVDLAGVPCTGSSARLVNVKREQQTDDDRLAESAPARMRIDPCRTSGNSSTSRSTNLSEMGVRSGRLDDENVNSMGAIGFDSQSSLSYERYHRLMQQTCQPGLYGQNE